MREMRIAKRQLAVVSHKGFTLVELLVAMVVASIVLSAVVSLAYAMGKANDVSDDSAQKQAQVRYATLRISELIRHCKLICGARGDDLAVWRADDDGNGQININELVYIERGADRNYLRLCEFYSSSNPSIKLSDIATLVTGSFEAKYTQMMPGCGNVQFVFDVTPPRSRFLSISFDIVENDGVRRYQISTALRGWAGHLLDKSGSAIVSDDD
jgi:prepilin-type N-terminal cleavage/methylation domain-containing protein